MNEFEIENQLKQSTANIYWAELKSEILKEVIILVSSDLDLIEVAKSCALDRKENFESWLKQGKVLKTNQEQHQLWNQRNPLFKCCMVKPFVFLQEAL